MEINCERLKDSLSSFMHLSGREDVVLENFVKSVEYSEDDVQKILKKISKLLLQVKYTELIADCFPEYLLLLISLAVRGKDAVSDFGVYRSQCIMLSKLVPRSSEVLRFSMHFFDKKPPPFEEPSDQVPEAKRRKLDMQTREDEEIVKCCFNFLYSEPDFYKSIWSWSKFFTFYFQKGSDIQRVYANNVVAILTNMSQEELNLLNKDLSNEALIDFEESIRKQKSKILTKCDTGLPKTAVLKAINNFDLRLVNVEGVFLPVYNSKIAKKFYANKHVTLNNLVKVESTKTNLRNIAIGISSGKPICLSGPVGCGKTTLVEYLAKITGREKYDETEGTSSEKVDNSESSAGFLRIQFGDQTDSKMLLGQYRCTDVPGEFVWLPGPLTQAVMKGQWLLLEDLDLATQDTCTILSNLLEKKYLSVAGFRDRLKIEPGFQLFVTVRTRNLVNVSQKSVYGLLQKHLHTINVLPLSRSELCQIVSDNYPKLQTIVNRIVDVYLTFSSGDHDSYESNNFAEYNVLPYEQISPAFALKSGRLVSTRDLIKLCHRSNPTFTVTSTECAYFVFQNAVDIFCSYIPQSSMKTKLITSIGAKLGIIQSRCEYLSNTHKPEVQLESRKKVIGRAEITELVHDERTSENNEEYLQATKKQKLSPKDKKEIFGSLKSKERIIFSFTRIASCLLERVSVSVLQNEPILLVGETGVGKTSSVQYLANITNHKLVVLNMNNQSDIADLIGGYKPVDLKYVLSPIRSEFEYLFRKTFNEMKNEKFLSNISICFHQENYDVLIRLMIKISSTVFTRETTNNLKLENKKSVLKRWKELQTKLTKLSSQLKNSINISFAFISGSLVNCIKYGHWVLLDEINLASAETLECLSTILEPNGSLVLLEKGDLLPVKRHPEFRIFACMNPNTDIGKKDLPTGIRNRFTEFFVDELTTESDLMILIGDYLANTGIKKVKVLELVKLYKKLRSLSELELNDGLGNRPVFSLRTLCRALSITAKNLCGSVERNLYESFCLSFLTQLDPVSHKLVLNLIQKTIISNTKAVLSQPIPKPDGDFINFEGYWIQRGTKEIDECKEYILTDNVKTNLKDLARIISIGKLPVLLQGPTSAGKTSLIMYIAKRSGNYCLRINNHEHTDIQEYIGTYTSDTEGKLTFKEGLLVQAMRKGFWIILDELNLASTEILEALNRVLDDNRELFIPETQTLVKAHKNFMLFATQNPPGLYGGRKTLSRAFKNRFVELHFSEIPKDELEIILEKRCLIPKSYARKMVEVMAELQINRKTTSKQTFTLRDLFRWGNRYTYADKSLLNDTSYDWNQHLVDEGYLVLSSKVRISLETDIIEHALFKNFRKKINLKNLYTLNETTSMVTKDIIQSLKQYSQRKDIVWTQNMTRTAVLTAKALQFNEPVLLVGPTGCGKTTICQILAEIRSTKLRILNCHMHSEGADFLGGLRPCRSSNMEDANSDGAKKLFEWADGPLVQSMQEGSFFMADEISLAEDSVLERLNSVLEPERIVILAEKGGINRDIDILSTSTSDEFLICAKDGFQFLATMNPGGDFGKKELSPALRNRFTEIWCIPSDTQQDLINISSNFMEVNLLEKVEFNIDTIAQILIKIILYIQTKIDKFKFSVRDVLALSNYLIENSKNSEISFAEAIVYGLETIFLDSLEMIPHESIIEIDGIRKQILEYAIQQINSALGCNLKTTEFETKTYNEMILTDKCFGIKPFVLERVNKNLEIKDFYFDAPTTKHNLFRLLSALSLKKAVLLEGPPGVGKTSIVENLAKAIGFQIVRINLSEHTDLSDLFGTDLPLEDKSLETTENHTNHKNPVQAGAFAWRDGPLLAALKSKNTWILLDELNLAPQSVLEGLNAILDHRQEVFIPELNKTFYLGEHIRLFACQNPLKQGGGRKGLPLSFLNRFTKVYLRKLNTEDLLFVISRKYSSLFDKWKSYFESILEPYTCKFKSISVFDIIQNRDKLERSEDTNIGHLVFDLPHRLVKFSEALDVAISKLEFGYKGGPFEVNLRDILRWCELLENEETGFKMIEVTKDNNSFETFEKIFKNFLVTLYERMKVLYYNRMRCEYDRKFINNTFGQVFNCDAEKLCMDSEDVGLYWTDTKLYLNDIVIHRSNMKEIEDSIIPKRNTSALSSSNAKTIILSCQREILKNMAECMYIEKPIILSGPTDCGKTKLIDALCTITNKFCDYDIIDDSVTGSFLQIDLNRHLEEVSLNTEFLLDEILRKILLNTSSDRKNTILKVVDLMEMWSNYVKINAAQGSSNMTTMSEELELFRKRLFALDDVLKQLKSLKSADAHRKCIQFNHEVLSSLKKIVQNSETLNAGGHFEWVDSKIVRSLKTGTFICLDHVNLCSSAVLDRLNSVFEPNGNLLLSEKGMSETESENIVQKHKEFRAFLTLDPKNGELSRAMRNRCIEISIGNDPYTDNDLRHIIYSNGVLDFYLLEVIFKIHNRMKHVSDFTPFNVMHIVHFAFLVKSNKRLGLTDSEAICTSAKEVYVNSSQTDLLGHGLDYYKNHLMQIIIDELEKNPTEIPTVFELGNTIVSSSNMSTIAMVKLQCEPLRVMLQCYENTELTKFNMPQIGANPHLASDLFSIKLHLFLVYECSSFDDVELRSKYIASIIKATYSLPQGVRDELLLLNNLLFEIICEQKRTSKCSLTYLPWNNKLFGRIRDYHGDATTLTNAMNVSACLLCDTIMENVMTEGINKLNQMSILDYSKATHAKQISDSFHNVVLEHCYYVLTEVKSKVLNGLIQTNIDVLDYADIIISFLWVNRTLKISKEKVLKNKTINGPTVDTLALHFKWLGKHCIDRINKITESEEPFRKSFYIILDSVKDLTGKPTNVLQKSFCKSILDFRPFFEEIQTETEEIRNKYDALLQMIPFYGSISFDDALKKICVMSIPESIELKSMLSHQMQLADLMDLDREEMLDIASVPDFKTKSVCSTLKEKLFPSDCFDELHEKFAFIEDAKIFVERLEQKLSEVDNQKTKNSIEMLQLCSLKEYFSNRAFSIIASNDCRQVQFNIEFFKQIPTLNSSSLGLLNLVLTRKFKIFEEFWLHFIRDLDVSNLRNVIAALGRKNYKCISTFFRSLNYACQQYILANIATHNRICLSLLDQEDIQAEHSYDGPMLTNIILNLFSQSNGDLRPIELGSLDMWRNTLHEANQIIWNNIHLMDVKHDKSVGELTSSILQSRKLLSDILVLKEDLILAGKFNVDDCKDFWRLVEMLANKFELANTYMTNNHRTDNFMSSFMRTYFSSMINILIGSIELSLFTYTPLIDPVEKNYLKREYSIENIKFLADLLNAYDSLKAVLNYRNYGREICEVLEIKKSKLADEQQKYVQKVPLRPTCNVYKKLAEEINHFFHTNCEPENFIKIIIESDRLVENVINNGTFIDAFNGSSEYFAKLQEAIDTFDMWIVNSQNFLHHVLAKYALYYKDFVQPITCAIVMAQYGFEQLKSLVVMLKTSLKETLTGVTYNVNSKEKLSTALKCIAEFPLMNNLYMKQEINQENDIALFTLLNNLERSEYEKYLLLKAKSLEVKNMVAITKYFESNLFSQFNHSLQMFANVWLEEEEKRKARKEEEENLYVTKYHAESLTEEEIEEQEIEQNFPNFAVGDYEQFVDNDTLNNMRKEVKTTKSDQWELLTEDEIYMFVKNFTHLMEHFTSIYYYKPTKIGSDIDKLDVLHPFKLRFKVFRKLFSEYKTATNEYSDSILYNSFSLLIGLQQEAINEIKITKTETQPQNFYKDSNLSEIVSCVDVLNKIQPRVEKQLELYPDHAVLNDIIKIIEKIKSLPSTAPVVRFNVGFQMLRQKIAQWNEVAHKNNNFLDLETNVAEYVQRWTRLELTYWRNCLSQTYEDVQKPTYKYWFFLYDIFQEHLFNNKCKSSEHDDTKLSQKSGEDGDKTESSDILKVLKQFIESSNYADFSLRLKLLKSFEFYLHHVTCDRNYKRKVKLISMLHNLYMYYDQFSQEVDEYIKSKKAPIEKKLRELVKIESYNKDLSYFSMRNNVARVHRNLNKYLKEYAAVLKEGIGKTLEVKEQSGKDFNLDNDKGINLRFEAKIKYYMLDVKNFIAPQKLKDQINLERVKTEGSNQTLLLKSKKYFAVSRNVVNKTISNANYPQLIHSLDLLLSEQTEYCDYLRKLEVDRTQEKPKQKAQAKHILNQKKKALSDLFKTLSTLGLSFKAGLREFTLNEELVAFKAPPFCVKTMFKKYKKLDQNLIYLSENLDNYYAKCCFKIVALKNILLSPQVDLGSINFDRIKGFSVDMFLLVQKQREIIGKNIKELYDLRNIISDIGTLSKCVSIPDNDHNEMLNFASLREKYDVICASSSKIRHVFEQFSLLLKCAPRESTAEFAATSGPSYVLQQTNPKHIQIVEKVELILKESSKLSSDISNLNDTEFLPFMVIEKLEARLKTVIKNVRDVREEFLLHDDNYMIVVKPILKLLLELERMSNLNGESYETEHNIDINRLDKELETLMHKLLIGFQNMYKKYPDCNKKEEETAKEADESDTYTILDGHLKEKVNDELLSDFNTLGLSNIITKLSKILLRIKYEKNAELKRNSIEKIAAIYPIVEQYNLLGDYLLFQFLGMHKISTKILCILLTVFIEVGTKGFCIPADLLQDEEGEAKKEQTGSGGFGFEDGTGENDISDKIESEDQLDDAKRPEDRDKEEKNEENCKEEKGIDMSEDFDAKMQDLDKQNNSDESEESEEDEDVDKQMGEAEEGEKLDEQIWGSDDEDKNSEDEEDLNEDDGAEGAKDEGDQHNDLSNKESKSKNDANEDGLEATKDDDKTSKKEKEKDIDDMKDPEVDEDQINPYHNELEEPPEPEDLDLGDNVDIDEENCKDGDEMENNPFDIDSMKENMEPKEDEAGDENKELEENEKGDESESDSEDEEAGENKPTESNKAEENTEETPQEEEDAVEEDGAPDDTQNEKPEEDEKPQENENENENGTVEEESDQNKDDKEVREIDRNPTKEEKAESAPDEQASNDNAIDSSEKENATEKPDKTDQQDTGKEKEGTGVAENDVSDEGHKGQAHEEEKKNFDNNANQNNVEDRRKPGKANEERTLGEANEKQPKQLKTIDKVQEEAKDNEQSEGRDEAEEYQHVKEARKDDSTTMDTATKEQSEKIQHQEDEENKPNEEENMDDVPNDEQIDEDVQNVENINSEHNDQKSDKPAKNERLKDQIETTEKMEVEGEDVVTSTVTRAIETTAHLSKDMLSDSKVVDDSTAAEMLKYRKLYENQLTELKAVPEAGDCDVWQSVSNKMLSSARDLCEQLRLILEPTKCTRLKGDYRTGRRINMKKIIPYIASQFRKDKIWLRRTKPSQRDYKITIAIDDSKSMHHNNSKTLTLEAISLVSQALNLLESGKLSVVSFGEAPKVIIHHTEQFDGPKLVKNLNFDQNQSKIADLLDFIRTVDSEDKSSSSTDLFENLLLILSDGRNINAEGEQKVKNTVKLARLQRIFLLYIIIDNPDNKDSILDIRVPHFSSDRKSMTIKPYLDSFPFPYYIIVRDLAQLPLVLSEAMRQWFELVNSESQ